MKSSIALSLLLLSAFVHCHEHNEHESEKEFEERFHKHYNDADEEKKAAEELEKSEQELNHENTLYDKGEALFFEELNKDSDLPKDVFKKEKEGHVHINKTRGLGHIRLPENERKTDAELKSLYERQTAPPPSWNSVAKKLVTPVKDQGQCGSCAAFSATAVHETCMLRTGTAYNGLDLSEQYLLDCGYDPNDYRYGCNGANAGKYINYYATSMKGVSPHEYDYFYLNSNPKLVCPKNVAPRNFGAKVTAAKNDYDCSESKLATLIYKFKAVSVSIYASDRAFHNYAGGIFNGCTSTETDHAVTAVGYGTENGTDYWLIKNSWGSSWGLNGYVKIKRGVGMCGIGGDCYTATCASTSGALSPIPPAPVAATCQMGDSSLTGMYRFQYFGKAFVLNCIKGWCNPPTGTTNPNACIAICGDYLCL